MLTPIGTGPSYKSALRTRPPIRVCKGCHPDRWCSNEKRLAGTNAAAPDKMIPPESVLGLANLP